MERKGARTPRDASEYHAIHALQLVFEFVARRHREARGIFVSRRKIGGQGYIFPVETFADHWFPGSVVKEEMLKAGFVRPTPIQSQVWPIASTGHNLLGVAETGSGKTLAYLLPAILHMKSKPYYAHGPTSIVLAPSKDLALEIQHEYTRFCGAAVNDSLYLGDCLSYPYDWPSLGKGIRLLITTPLGLSNLLRKGKPDLKRVTYLVLDGVDWMLEMDFENIPEFLTSLQSKVSSDCQKLFFSVHCPERVQNLAERFLCNYFKVEIDVPRLTTCMHHTVDVCTEDQKYGRLEKFLSGIATDDISEDEIKILVFFNTWERCDDISLKLFQEGWNVVSIPECKNQAERDQIVSRSSKFKSLTIMTATDVAVRDVDVKNVHCIVNYDFPRSLDEFIQRIELYVRRSHAHIGRSFTLFTAANARYATKLIRLLKISRENSELDALRCDAPHSGKIDIPSWLQRAAIHMDGREDEGEEKVGDGVEMVFGGPRPVKRTYEKYRQIENAACFALEEVKKRKNIKLHFVEVLEAYKQECNGPYEVYYLTLKVVDDREVKACRAIVGKSLIDEIMQVELFGVVDRNGDFTKEISDGDDWAGSGVIWINN